MKNEMDFTIKRDVFLEGVQKTLGIVDKKTTLSILNNILIEATGFESLPRIMKSA